MEIGDEKGDRRITHYSSSHKILLVGEGDFSFSNCLAKAFGSAFNMTGTSLDSELTLMDKYPKAMANVKELKDLGCTIIHEVDAGKMKQHYTLNSKYFDRIVFNFPHAGFILREDNNSMIERHKKVVREFLRNARDLLTANGEVHVTHKTGNPYSKWEIEKLGEEAGLRLIERAPFLIWEYSGYENKRGAGSRCNETFLIGQCATFKFVKG